MMSDTEELHVGDFNPSTYEHVLPEGAHDFDDYDCKLVPFTIFGTRF